MDKKGGAKTEKKSGGGDNKITSRDKICGQLQQWRVYMPIES